MNIKTINLKDLNAGKDLVQSFRDTGFAVITNHDIDKSLIDHVYNSWSNYFGTDSKFKDLFAKDRQRGYYPMKSENAKGFDKKDLKEFFHIYPDSDINHIQDNESTMELFSKMQDLGAHVLGMINANLDENVKSLLSIPLQDMSRNSPQNLLRVLHYPPIDDADGAVRAAPHEDINLITLLPAATFPGLQVMGKDGEWVFADLHVPHNSIIINAGDMLQEATAGYFKSTTHRVLNPTGHGASLSRYSMPMFVHPHPHVRLSDKYTAEEYLNERLKELGLK